ARAWPQWPPPRTPRPGRATPRPRRRSSSPGRGLGRALEQIGADETVDVAVEDPPGVADLVARAVVLDPLGRVEGVAADLRSPADLGPLPALGRQLLGPPSLLELEQPSPQ